MPDKKEDQQTERQKEQQQDSALKWYAIYSHLVFTMAACIFGGVFLGKFLDDRLGTSPGLLILLTLLGIAAAFWAIFRLAKTGGK